MIINRDSLLLHAPIKGMLSEKISHAGVTHGLSEAGYDIRIKQEVRFRDKCVGAFVPGEHPPMYAPKRVYGSFILASTIEEFDMPYNLVGVVHDKSTWARRGLSVFNTVIEPGWKGFLTLELVYHGSEPLTIPAGAGIAQVVFHRTSDPSFYTGRYQNQTDNPVPAQAAD